MEKIKSTLYELEEDLDSYLFYDKEELKKQVWYDDGFEDGISKCIKKLLQHGMPLNEIEELLELDEREIKAFKESFKSSNKKQSE